MSHEHAVSFRAQGHWLYGIIHLPEGRPAAKEGVLIAVGGPQYRIGSHRQFVLLARFLADRGVPVMRFDYHGMGDSEGNAGRPEPCEHVAADLRAAIDKFHEHVPSLSGVTLWGLCDGATAALLYAPDDNRVTGLVLVNPWISTTSGAARAFVRHYYAARLLRPAFWKRLAGGKVQIGESLRYLLRKALEARRASVPPAHPRTSPEIERLLPERVSDQLGCFKGRLLLVLSGRDLIADELKERMSRSRLWTELLTRPNVTRVDFADANHTFSSRDLRNVLSNTTFRWLQDQPLH